MTRPSKIVLMLAAATVAVRPAMLPAQRAGETVSIPVARNATPAPALEEEFRTGRAPASLSDAERVALVTSAGVAVGGITGKVTLSPNSPHDSNAYLGANGQFVAAPTGTGTGFIRFSGPKCSLCYAAVAFRVLQPDRPVLIDFISEGTHASPSPIRLTGSGISATQTIAKGVQHVSAIILPKTIGWYELFLYAEQGGVRVHAVELTVLE